MKERDLLTQTKQFLRLLERAGKLTFTRIHCMPVIRNVGHRKIYSHNRDMAGFADIEVVANARIGYLELKAPKGKLTTNQIAFRDRVVKHGAHHSVARSLIDVVVFLTEDMKIDVKLIG